MKDLISPIATGSTANTLKKSDMDVMTNQRCRRTWGASSILSSHICINDHDSDSSACMVSYLKRFLTLPPLYNIDLYTVLILVTAPPRALHLAKRGPYLESKVLLMSHYQNISKQCSCGEWVDIKERNSFILYYSH